MTTSDGLLRLALALMSWYISLVASRPPRPPATAEERSAYENNNDTRDMTSRIIWWYAPVISILLYAITIGEVLFDLISWAPSLRDHVPHFAQSLCAHSAAQNIRVTPAFLVGCSLSIAGGILRLICYRALGRQFTFELSLRKADKLITSGPYAYVRHPSYTGAFACIIGYVVWLLSSGSWFAECGMWQTTGGRAYALTSIVVVVFFLTTVLKRIEKEDRVLRDTYGAQWDAWAKKTPYRVLPGIY